MARLLRYKYVVFPIKFWTNRLPQAGVVVPETGSEWALRSCFPDVRFRGHALGPAELGLAHTLTRGLVKRMNEERVRELESWAQGSRAGLTASECVLLDAISEACREIQGLWKADQATSLELRRFEARVLELQDELRQDRRAMEGAELGLTIGETSSADKARELLADRLAALEDIGLEPPQGSINKADLPGVTD